jgi:5'-3' exonuclease
MGAMFSQKVDNPNEDMLRHLILNSLRCYNTKYRAKYGQMVLACDGGSWRNRVFAEYKASRKTNREASTIDWKSVFEIFNKVRAEIIEHMPYKVVYVPGAEADDIIATLVESTQEFGNTEDVMIVSADHDFIQLQKYKNVSQFSPSTKKLVTDKNPRKYLLEHIFRGDGGDGVPNVLSDDDTFITDKRQKPLKAKMIDEWIANYSRLKEIMSDELYRNYYRNLRVIDLSYIPDDITSAIMTEYNAQVDTPNSKVLAYLISKRCKQLISCAAEFFPHK